MILILTGDPHFYCAECKIALPVAEGKVEHPTDTCVNAGKRVKVSRVQITEVENGKR